MTSGGDLNVELEELSQTAAWLDNTARDLMDRRAKIQRDADDVLLGSWQGAPAKKVRSSWDEWVDGFDRVMQALDESRQLLETARRQYGDQDSTTASRLSATAPRLGGLNLDV